MVLKYHLGDSVSDLGKPHTVFTRQILSSQGVAGPGCVQPGFDAGDMSTTTSVEWVMLNFDANRHHSVCEPARLFSLRAGANDIIFWVLNDFHTDDNR
jgi:hypothetical protein